MALKFITGNKNKFAEVQASLAPFELAQVDTDLDEIQDLDAHVIIRHKLLQALEHGLGPLIVEDSSLYLECLENKLPGPFLKWFSLGLGVQKLADIVERLGNNKATAQCLIGYADNEKNIRFFEGLVFGSIVQPRGDKDFGYGPIFQPDGQNKTFGEMEREEKYAISMRGVAVRKLKEFLISQK